MAALLDDEKVEKIIFVKFRVSIGQKWTIDSRNSAYPFAYPNFLLTEL
jgi:hypothetical protein